MARRRGTTLSQCFDSLWRRVQCSVSRPRVRVCRCRTSLVGRTQFANYKSCALSRIPVLLMMMSDNDLINRRRRLYTRQRAHIRVSELIYNPPDPTVRQGGTGGGIIDRYGTHRETRSIAGVVAHGGGGLRGAPLTRGADAAPAAPAGSGGGSSGLLARRDMSEAAPGVPCTAGARL